MKRKIKPDIIHYDRDVDVLYIVVKEGPEDSVVEAAPGINVELDKRGRLLGVEILNASKNLRALTKARRSRVAA